MTRAKLAVGYAVLAAGLYALNIPLSKLLLQEVSPTMMAALLYLGAGLGISVLALFKKEQGSPLTKKELPYTIGMIVLDIAAPIFLMLGLTTAEPANASLLNNFEIVATSLIALAIFREKISARLWRAIALVTLSSAILSFEDVSSFSFSRGSLLVLCACICWGFENNCTRMLSSKNVTEIVIIKGVFSGLGSLVIALCIGERLPALVPLCLTLCLGFVAYGLSILFYIKAQCDLGAAKTSAYYAISPFLGVVFSILLFGGNFSAAFCFSAIIMLLGTYFIITDTIALQHVHPHMHVHTHMHSHGGVVHIHDHSHDHVHSHIHADEDGLTHSHTHEQLPPEHEHKH